MKFQIWTHTTILCILGIFSVFIVAGCDNINTKETVQNFPNSMVEKEPTDSKEISESVQLQVDSLTAEKEEGKRETSNQKY